MESVTHFITHRLKLKVNQAKSAVAQPRQRKFLGFSFTRERAPRRRIAPKAIARFKERIREQTRRTRGISLTQMVKDLATYLRGWLGYFGDCQTPSVLQRALIHGYAVDSGLRCGSNGSRDERDFANFANGAWAKTWRRKPPGVPTARGASQTRPPWPSLCRMLTLPSSDFRLWSCGQLNPPNRRMRTRLSGGVAGEERRLSPLCRFLGWQDFYSGWSGSSMATFSRSST